MTVICKENYLFEIIGVFNFITKFVSSGKKRNKYIMTVFITVLKTSNANSPYKMYPNQS